MSEIIKLLGVELPVRDGADTDRIEKAATLVNERYEEQKASFRGSQSKDILLAFVALGLADELLRMKMTQDETRERVSGLVEKIEKSL